MLGTMGLVIMKRLSRLWSTRRFVWCRHSLTKRARRTPATPGLALCRQASVARCVGRSSNAKTITGDTCASTPACYPFSVPCVRAASIRVTTYSTISSAAACTPTPAPQHPPLTSSSLRVTTLPRLIPEAAKGQGIGGGHGNCLLVMARLTSRQPE